MDIKNGATTLAPSPTKLCLKSHEVESYLITVLVFSTGSVN